MSNRKKTIYFSVQPEKKLYNFRFKEGVNVSGLLILSDFLRKQNDSRVKTLRTKKPASAGHLCCRTEGGTRTLTSCDTRT